MITTKFVENQLNKKPSRIIDHKTLTIKFSHLSNINQKISNLIKSKNLIKIQRGKYYLSKTGYTSLNSYEMANILGESSFLSFEEALKYYGFFNQGLKVYRSISQKQYLDKTIENVKYKYIKVVNTKYKGFKLIKMDNKYIRIATMERALLDLIEYQRTYYSVSLVIEIISEHTNDINFNSMFMLLKSYSQTTNKIVGVILDSLNINTELIKQNIQSKKSTHRLFNSSDKFNSKWRIYFNSILINDSFEHNKSKKTRTNSKKEVAISTP